MTASAECSSSSYCWKATTPVNISQLEYELTSHCDRNFVSYLCSGLRHGFDTKIATTDILQHGTIECKNNLSARSRPESVARLIKDECQKGFMYGPFDTLPFSEYRVSPLGVSIGKYSGKERLILDLSAPHTDLGVSVNETIDKDSCSMSYVKVDDAIRVIIASGVGAWLCKFDIADAFKICPIKPAQWPLFCIKWNSSYYFYVRITFGCRSSPKIFDTLSQAICYIAVHNYKVSHILHLLDDFLTIDKPDNIGERNMAIMTTIFKRLNIPLSVKKTVGPTTCLEYLGIILDSQKMEARLPADKVQRICDCIKDLEQKTVCTKRQLLQLLGHLNFASRIILPGRSFVSYLINLSTTAKDLHDFVHLNKECRTDLTFWLTFLQQWNGVNMFYNQHLIDSPELDLYTDASATLGFGGYYHGKWFSSSWPLDIPEVKEKSLSIAYKELYPIVVAAILWGNYWAKQQIVFWCDNEATVAIVNKGRSKCLYIMELMRKLTWCACIYNFNFRSKHVPGKCNSISDSLSRLQIQRFRTLAPQADTTPHRCPPYSKVIWN